MQQVEEALKKRCVAHRDGAGGRRVQGMDAGGEPMAIRTPRWLGADESLLALCHACMPPDVQTCMCVGLDESLLMCVLVCMDVNA
jgi:hypothetical protein